MPFTATHAAMNPAGHITMDTLKLTLPDCGADHLASSAQDRRISFMPKTVPTLQTHSGHHAVCRLSRVSWSPSHRKTYKRCSRPLIQDSPKTSSFNTIPWSTAKIATTTILLSAFRNTTFDPAEAIYVLYFLLTFKTTCKIEGGAKKAAMWLFHFFILNPAEPISSDRSHLQDSSSKLLENVLSWYRGVVNYLLARYATENVVTK